MEKNGQVFQESFQLLFGKVLQTSASMVYQLYCILKTRITLFLHIWMGRSRKVHSNEVEVCWEHVEKETALRSKHEKNET